MEDTEIILLIIGVLAVVIVFGKTAVTRKTIRKDLIQDDKVTPDLVEEKLEQFTPKIVAKRKGGFTENDVQGQLEKYLKDIFQSVTREHAVEGKNTKMIDFDIGNGKVGIEVKIADKVIKEREGDRLLGQLLKYSRRKYNKENLIIFICGFDGDERNTVIQEIEEDVLANKSRFVIRSAGSKELIQIESNTK